MAEEAASRVAAQNPFPKTPQDDAKKESCVQCVDALWFCYSPVYQLRQYYREGEFDSCLEKWTDFTDCMLLRTAAAERIKAKRAAKVPVVPPLWTLRTPEEAAPIWQAQFGHLDEP